MSTEINVGLRLTASNSGYVPPVQEARAETEKLGQALKDASAPTAGLADAMKNAAPATEGLTGAMNGSYAAGALLGTGLLAVGAAALAAAGFIGNMVRSTIESNAQLSNFAEQSGLSVEALSALKDVAEITGTSFDKVVSAGSNLAKSMYKNVDAFGDLGISVKNTDGTLRSQDAVLLEVAQRFAGMKDGATKTALAQQIFGRSGADLISVLNELGKSSEYNATVTGRQAQLADELGKALVRLTKTTDGLWQSLANEITPSLAALAKGLVEGINKAGGLRDQLVDLISKGEIALWAERAAVWVGELIDRWVDYRKQTLAIVDLTKLAGSAFSAFGTIMSGVDQIMRGRLVGGMADLKKGWTDLKQAGTEFGAVLTASLTPSHAYRDAIIDQVYAIQTATDEGKKNTDEVRNQGKAHGQAKVKIADYRDEIARLDAQLLAVNASYDGGTAKLSNYAKAQLQVQKDIDSGKKVISEQVDALLASAKALDDGEAAAKKYAEAQKANTKEADALRQAFEKADEWEKKRIDNFKKLKDASEGNIANLRAEIAMIGMSVPEQIAYTAELEKQALAKQNLTTEERAALAAQIDTTAQLKLQKVQAQDTYAAWKDALESVRNVAYNFIMDVVEKDWKTAFKNLWKDFTQRALQAFADIAAQKIAVSLVGTFAAGGANASGMPGISGGGLGGIWDMVSGGASTLLDSFGSAGTMVTNFAADISHGVGVVDAFSTALDIGTAGIGTLVPAIGAVAAAGMLLYNWLGSKRGGPKEGGFATSGATPGIGGTDDSGRWFTPTTRDSDLQTAVHGIDNQYQTILALLGGTGSATFAQGFSTDPRGTAPSNVHTGAWVNGQQVFDNPNGNVGRDDASLQAELATQASRAILAALQSSELPDVVSGYLASIDVSTATIEQINAALEHAAGLKVLVDQVAALPEEMANGLIAALGVSPELDAKIASFAAAFKEFSDAADALHAAIERNPGKEAADQIAAASETTFASVGRLRGALDDALASYDGTTASTKSLTDATNAYVDAQVAALVQITQIRSGLDSMFGDTIRNMDLALMSTGKQKDFYINEALAAQKLLADATDPAEIDRLTRLINKDLIAAFQLMDPKEQERQHDYLKGILETTQDTANAQLDLAQQAVEDAGQNATDILGRIDVAVSAAADKQAQAAADLMAAATAMREAAAAAMAAATAQAAAATNAATAATGMNTAAITMQTAANTPQQVYVTVESIAGP